MAVIMLPRLFIRVGFSWKRFMSVVMMTEVLSGFSRLVPAMVDHRSPGDLERKQTQQEEHE